MDTLTFGVGREHGWLRTRPGGGPRDPSRSGSTWGKVPLESVSRWVVGLRRSPTGSVLWWTGRGLGVGSVLSVVWVGQDDGFKYTCRGRGPEVTEGQTRPVEGSVRKGPLRVSVSVGPLRCHRQGTGRV